MIGQYQSGGLLVAHTPPSHYYRMKLKHTPGFRSRRLIARAPALEPVIDSSPFHNLSGFMGNHIKNRKEVVMEMPL